VAGLSGTATSAASVIAGDRIAVLVLLAPDLYLFFFSAFDTPLTHLLIVLNLCFRKFTVLPEDDVEAKSEDSKSDKNQCCNEYLHIINKIPSVNIFFPTESFFRTVSS
jgi:hypothetical protein